jgi:hypothetical protein
LGDQAMRQSRHENHHRVCESTDHSRPASTTGGVHPRSLLCPGAGKLPGRGAHPRWSRISAYVPGRGNIRRGAGLDWTRSNGAGRRRLARLQPCLA